MKLYLQLIANKPIPDQIEILKSYLRRCTDQTEILDIGKLIRAKQWQLQQPPEPAVPVFMPTPIAAPQVEETARIAQLCQKLRWYLLDEKWEETASLLRIFIEEQCQLSQEQYALVQEALQKLREQRQKNHPLTPNKRQIALGKLGILITNGNLQPAQQIANSLLLENDDFWASPEVDRFQKLLVDLKKLELEHHVAQNLPAQITALEEEKKVWQQERQALMSTQQQTNSQALQNSHLLRRLEVMAGDPAHLVEARNLATHICEQGLQFLSPEQVEAFKKSLQALKDQEAKQRHQQDLAVQVEQLQRQLTAAQKQCAETEQQHQLALRDKENLQSTTVALQQAREEIERLKKLAATVAALVYVKDPSLLLSASEITFRCNEYIKSSHKGANPGYPASVRDVILSRFQDCFEAYDKLLDADEI